MRLLRRQARLRDLVRLAELLVPDQQAHSQTQGGKARIDDPHRAEGFVERLAHDLLLGRGQRVHDADRCPGGAAAECGGEVRAESGDEDVGFLDHLVLEDDAADDDADGGGEVADEAEGGGCGGHVFAGDLGLQCEERGLEVGADADAGDDLEDDDFGPCGAGVEVDEEAEAEGGEEEAEPDGWEVLAGLLDEDAGGAGGEGEG